MSEDKAILENIWADFSTLQQLSDAELQDGRFSVYIDDGRFE